MHGRRLQQSALATIEAPTMLSLVHIITIAHVIWVASYLHGFMEWYYNYVSFETGMLGELEHCLGHRLPVLQFTWQGSLLLGNNVTKEIRNNVIEYRCYYGTVLLI